ncbi:30S ribosomal protein S17e [Candidatus Woesearchaeota archaeon CG_4_10_14_0_2_um_filter_57_5]|nr:MAG: 30S ribosomal protein S17e [Candidatus Woesearchaeota archaeon CG_4_10_14_0_2_um_filter_57_5]
MGRIKTVLVKRVSRELVDNYEDRLSTDYATNKQSIKSLAHIPSKKIENVVAGYVTRLMRARKAA